MHAGESDEAARVSAERRSPEVRRRLVGGRSAAKDFRKRSGMGWHACRGWGARVDVETGVDVLDSDR
jgi:hypothetical protein